MIQKHFKILFNYVMKNVVPVLRNWERIDKYFAFLF